MNGVTGYLPLPKSFETICMHHAQDPKQWKSQAVIPHIVMSTVFHIDDPAKPEVNKFLIFIVDITISAVNILFTFIYIYRNTSTADYKIQIDLFWKK